MTLPKKLILTSSGTDRLQKDRRAVKNTSKLPGKSAGQKKRSEQLLADLYECYPYPKCALNFTNPFELLVATILSAQCTDVRVNIVTIGLFKTWPTPYDMANAPLQEIEEAIKTTGFYRNKAKAIKESAQKIVNEFNGEVPQTMDELLSLRGVARKTANVVLGNAFGLNEGVVVDTHVNRLVNRFGLTRFKEPVKIERDLMALFPREEWTNLAHLLIAHGRSACKARFSKPPNHPICKKYGRNCTCNKMR
ncbi:MAG: endonuclease III [Balneolales bacterium]